MANQNLLQRIGSRVGHLFAAKSAPPSMQAGWGRSWNILGDTGAISGFNNTPSDWMAAAQQFVWASNCVIARSNAIASVPIKLYQRSTDPEQTDPDEITDHPILDLLRQVNELNLDETSFKREGERNLAVHGEWVSSVSLDSGNKPTELYILQPAALMVNRDVMSGYPESYLYGGRITFTPDQLVRIYYPRLDDQIMAQSPTATAIAAMNRYVKADSAQETIDQAGGMTRGILGADFSMINTDQAEFAQSWNAKKLDQRRQHEDMFLPQGMTRESGVMSAQEQEREIRMERLKKEVFAAYNVPPAMAGDYSDASVLANADQQERVFWTLFGVAECGLITEGLNTQLLWRYWPETREAGIYLAFDLSTVSALQANKLEEAQLEMVYAEVAGSRYTSLVSTLNESREYLGLDKLKDPRANIIAFPEQIPSVTPTEGDKTNAVALNGDNMSQIRQVTRDFQVGKYTHTQADSLIRMAAPDITDIALEALLMPVDKPVEVKPDLIIKDMATVVDALDAYNQNMISLPQARALLQMALPDAIDSLIVTLLQRPKPEPVEPAAQTPITPPAAPVFGPDGEQIEPDEPIEPDPPPSADDIAIDFSTDLLLAEAVELGAIKAFKPRDPDSIKRGPDGRFAETPNAPDKPQSGAVDYSAKLGGGKGKKGKAKKPKKTDEQKAKEKADRKAKRDAERVAKLQSDMDALKGALSGLEGKDDPSKLKERINRQLERIQAKIDSISTGREAGTQKLLNEAGAQTPATKAMKHEGAMIALMLPSETAAQLQGYQMAIIANPATEGVEFEPPEEMHITLAYLGKAELLSDWARALISEVVRETARETAVPLSFMIKGSGRFTNPSGDALWAGVGVEGLSEMRACLVRRLRELGINVPLDHGDYQPHITLAYLPAGMPAELLSIQPVRVDLSSITVMMAGEREDIPFGLRAPDDTNAPLGMPTVRYVSAKAAMQIVDYVGMNAISAQTGNGLGVIEKIARFGEHQGITATKAEPVVYVDGVAYPASYVRVIQSEEENNDGEGL